MQLVSPADLPAGIEEKIQKAALLAFSAAGCEGLARIDFFYSNDDQIVINEINTMPGFTASSVFPKLWAAGGIGYTELITNLIEAAIARPLNVTR